MYPFCRKRHNSLVNPENEYEECLQSKSHASGFAIIEFHNSILNFNLYFWIIDKLKSHIAQNFPLENKKTFLATSGWSR
jgi:hypothetical protein